MADILLMLLVYTLQEFLRDSRSRSFPLEDVISALEAKNYKLKDYFPHLLSSSRKLEEIFRAFRIMGKTLEDFLPVVKGFEETEIKRNISALRVAGYGYLDFSGGVFASLCVYERTTRTRVYEDAYNDSIWETNTRKFLLTTWVTRAFILAGYPLGELLYLLKEYNRSGEYPQGLDSTIVDLRDLGISQEEIYTALRASGYEVAEIVEEAYKASERILGRTESRAKSDEADEVKRIRGRYYNIYYEGCVREVNEFLRGAGSRATQRKQTESASVVNALKYLEGCSLEHLLGCCVKREDSSGRRYALIRFFKTFGEDDQVCTSVLTMFKDDPEKLKQCIKVFRELGYDPEMILEVCKKVCV